MILRTWQTPNFVVTGTDSSGTHKSFPMYSRTREELIERLKERMPDIQIQDVEPYEFGSWVEKARKILEKLERALTHEERSDILRRKRPWVELKEHLFDLFHGRCAYCERSPVEGGSYGDVDHFRPKNGVAEDRTHPGYYWLALCPLNFLPSCQLCNGKFKRTQFPVKDGIRAFPSQGVSDERPLLLHPYGPEDPRRHIRFVMGNPEGLTEVGIKTIEVFGLGKQGDLKIKREAAQSAIEGAWKARKILKGGSEAFRELREELFSGSGGWKFAAASLDRLDQIEKNWKSRAKHSRN